MPTIQNKSSRMLYIDGLKLLMCYMIMLIHFAISYFPEGFIGFGSVYEPAERSQAFWASLPYSLYTNSSLPLHVFFALIALLPTIAFYKSKQPYLSLQRQAIKRYFRFMLPVAAAIIGTSCLYSLGMLDFKGLAQLRNSHWCLAIEPEVMSLPTLLYHAFVQVYFENGDAILTVTWCMYIIFLGSMLTLALLALFGNSPFRRWLYLASIPVLLSYPTYAAFIVGIACGDFYVHCLPNLTISKVMQSLISWLLLALGIFIGYLPDFVLPSPLTLFYTYAVASGMVILALMLNPYLQRLLSHPLLVQQAKYSFGVLLVHTWILTAVSKPLYQMLMPMTDNICLKFTLCFVICMVLTHLLAIPFHHLFEKPSQALADYVYQRYGS